MSKEFTIINRYIANLLIIASLFFALPGKALPSDFYAGSSVLSSGKWAKISVKETGMQFISNAQLKTLGFSDPAKVNVYGFGGRMLPESLNSSMKDDLPVLPSVRTAQGIVFFGFSTIGWEINNSGIRQYKHSLNPYSSSSYYFISDKETEHSEQETQNVAAIRDADIITVFTERIVHENDLLAPSNTGRLLLGEDFRSTKSRNFLFDLPGNTGNAIMTVAFGAKTSSGNSSLVFSANGETLKGSSSDVFPSSNSSKFIETTLTTKEISDPGEKLNLVITYSAGGNITTSALDYIEIEYPRELKLQNNELYFYLNPQNNTKAEISGASENTILWDITDHTNPKVVEATLSGDKLTFTAPADYHEYVAFNPTGIKREIAPAGKLGNQDIHSMGAPGMLIISPEIYRPWAQEIAALHDRTDGLEVLVLSPEEIYNEFSSGTPDVTAFRKLLKMWKDRSDANGTDYTRYCLIMSRPTYDNKMVTQAVKNAGYPRVPIWQSPTGDTESSSYSTDDYIGMLDDNNTELNIGKARIHVAVGRMPVKSQAEAANAVSKLSDYLERPKLGAWRNNVMLIADDQDNGVHLNQAERCYEAMRSQGNGKDFLYEKLYLDSFELTYTGTGASYPGARQRLFEKLAEGVLYIDYIGHANPKAWGHEGLLTWTDIKGISNTNLPFIYAATCEFLRWDDDAVSGAEELWLNPTAGVIGMICPSRSVLISANGTLNEKSSTEVFKLDNFGKGVRVGDIMTEGKNNSNTDTNKLRYGLIGDPSMRLPNPGYNITTDRINGTDITATNELPVIKARSSVELSGRITDNAGNLMDDFNGIVEIQIYDAEKVITTNGNGSDGVESIYNDRKTRLFSGRVRAHEGKWETTALMPAEIENNYSPALISLYASDDTGREANGSCEKLYVYGYDTEAPEDYEGPDIIEFYLNSASFSNGDAVSPSPILKATFKDESGINISEAGMGHNMMISIDGKDHYTDVSLYYMPDETDFTGGKIAYPLKDIQPGDHELTLIVWDNANNSSSATLSFKVSASWKPEIETLTTDVNPASTNVNFIIATDGANGSMDCKVEIFDLSGRKIWSGNAPDITSTSNRVTLSWDLCDGNGSRVARGIYLYRATVTGKNGAIVTKTRKLAVTAG